MKFYSKPFKTFLLLVFINSDSLISNPTKDYFSPSTGIAKRKKNDISNTNSEPESKESQNKRPCNYCPTATTYFEKGCRFHFTRQYDKALKFYTMFINSNNLPNDPEITEKISIAYYRIALIYMVKNKFELAFENFLKADKFPEATKKVEIFNGLIDAHMDGQSYSDPSDAYHKTLPHSLEDKKKASILWSKIGEALFSKGNYNKACEAFEKSYQIDASPSDKTIEVLDYLHVIYDHRATSDQSDDKLIYQGYSENYLILGELMRAEVKGSSSLSVNP